MPWSCLCSSKKSKKTKYNKNIKTQNVPETMEEEKKSKPANNLRLDQCDRNPKTNNSSSLDSQFDQKSVNELNDHLYDSYDTLPNLKSKVEAPENSKNLLHKNKRASKFEDDNLVRAKHLILCLSNENLPFIDADSPGCSRYSNERIITMMPRNLLTSELNDWEKLKYMQKTYPSHKFIEVDVMDSQICQKCHRVLSFKKTYKCSMCDFTCHQHCVEKSGSYENRQQQLEKIESSQQHNRSKTPTSNWQLNYVTERILAAILPAKESHTKIDDLFMYDENGNQKTDKYETDLIHMLEQKHGKNFRLFDLESCIPTISLERLCELCKHIESWLSSGLNKMVVLQDRENFERVGTAVAAYLQYQKICSTNLAPYSIRSNVDDSLRNIQDLDEYSMQKFLSDTVGPIAEPTYRRYLEYFIGLLSGEIKINSLPLYLKFIKMESPPCMHHKISHYENEWSSFIKIFEGEKFVFISDIYVMPISTKQFIYEIKSPIILRGDIIIQFFQIHNKSRQTELISSIQFHTCAIARDEIEFHKNEISFPRSDDKFPPDHKITLIFTKVADSRSQNDILIFQNPLIRKEPISNYSSIGDLSQYTHGPVDGSLYATIAKGPATSPYPTNNNNELTMHNIRTIETRLNTPTSKNSRILSTILEWDNVRNGENAKGRTKSSYSQALSPRSKFPETRNYVRSPLMQSFDSGIYSHEVTSKNNQSSPLSWHDVASSPTANNNCHVELDNLLSEMMLTVETLPDVQQSAIKNKQIDTLHTTRRSNANEKTSPQSQASDVVYSQSQAQDYKRSHVHQAKTFNFDAFGGNSKNNQQDETSSITTTTLTPTESGRNTPATMSDQQSIFKSYYANDGADLYYDTDTQMQLHGGKRYHYVTAADDQRDQQQSVRAREQQQQRRNENLLQNSNQSHSYMELLRSEDLSAEDHQLADSNIPYHAREYSKPFTYGTIPSTVDGKMLKMQSGLSSPSMVRKALNQNGTTTTTITSVKKIPSREFEERAKYVRQSESKYTFGDKTPENNLSVFDNDKMFDYRNRSGSEHLKYKDRIENTDVESARDNFFEPLKRSNTMDGSFGRSGYASDGGSSQTWLQVQQQRLRAKRAQRQKEVFDFTDGTSQRSQTLSPVRNYNILAAPKEPKYIQIKRTTEQLLSKPYKIENSNTSPVDYNGQPTYHSYNEKYATSNNSMRRNLPVMSTPFEEMDHINNNIEMEKSPMETLDILLESIALESYATEAFMAQLVIGDTSDLITSANNNIINHTTESINRYIDNAISFNNNCENSNKHSSESEGSQISQSSSSDRMNGTATHQARNESVSSYRSETETEVSRPETPAFPVTPRTPFGGSTSTLPPKSPTLQRRDLSNRIHEVANVNETVSTYTSRRNSANSAISNANSEPLEIAPHHVKFARDSSKYWYRPTITREEAINLLRNAQPGTFLVRDSTTFANAFGLVVKVSYPPPGTKDQGGDELVRHFLVEPTVRGVRLKGCSNEPVFSSLSALIYQHSVTPLALPCRLIIPDRDLQRDFQSPAQQQLMLQGAACNVLYLFSADTESLTGPQAVRKAVKLLFERRPLPTPTEVHFKVSQQGITLTDNSRQLFFRKHYPNNTVTYVGLDPDDHRWSVHTSNSEIPVRNQHIFAFVAKKMATSSDNQCHIFCELEQRQPASAIVSFANKAIIDDGTKQFVPSQI